ncbi:MAG TPA: hypothetical protein VNH42_03380 [Mariprofundaceae bacterium]|nr:hypothetical protein [Mariprofundaceae bacterium]
MADEPSIDEILASLDRLLKEGEGRNDEPAESSPQPAGEAIEEPAGEVVEEPIEEATEEATEEVAEEPDPGFFTALDRAVSEPYNEVDTVEDERGEAEEDEEAARAFEAGAGHEAVAQAGPRRFVLTDAMLVNDVQQSLPLAMGDAASATPATAGHEEAKPVARAPAITEQAESEQPPVTGGASWDERDIQALVDQVTDDVCSAMAEQLPEMIRRALESRLSAFIDARVENEDPEPEE